MKTVTLCSVATNAMCWLFRSGSFLWSNLIDISFLHFNPVNGILENCEQYYSGVWFVELYKPDLTTESLDHDIVKKRPLNKSRWAVPSCGAVCIKTNKQTNNKFY